MRTLYIAFLGDTPSLRPHYGHSNPLGLGVDNKVQGLPTPVSKLSSARGHQWQVQNLFPITGKRHRSSFEACPKSTLIPQFTSWTMSLGTGGAHRGAHSVGTGGAHTHDRRCLAADMVPWVNETKDRWLKVSGQRKKEHVSKGSLHLWMSLVSSRIYI